MSICYFKSQRDFLTHPDVNIQQKYIVGSPDTAEFFYIIKATIKVSKDIYTLIVQHYRGYDDELYTELWYKNDKVDRYKKPAIIHIYNNQDKELHHYENGELVNIESGSL
ncbi:hypothetical protein [Motilimonas pumila]|uniref:Uncharacterized protein n=1 Tax=Motilimonas pumila TaxID=2303987 RepID=A0A418YA10_9GAMM|nr:hypothetical protein [Motilimonas pumila]RJG38782.1 hypothetical protein D1Z90_18735 [Motilimonas pumila]